ncbi:ATP-binding protein [Patescibacteria group bacterium]|nr:ATP-binding protein [Patescibacteria group bacterium]
MAIPVIGKFFPGKKSAAQPAPVSGAPKTPENQLTQQEKEDILKAEKIYRKGVVAVRDVIAPSSVAVMPDYLILDGKYVRTIFVFTFPRYVMTGWFAPVINLNLELDIAMFIRPISSEKILKTLRNKTGQIQSVISANTEKGEVRDPMLETALNDVEKLRDELVQGTEKLFHFGLYITLYENNKESLDETTKSVEDLLGQRLVYTKRCSFQCEQGFNSTIPMGNDKLDVTTSMNTSPLSTSFPFVSSELTSDDGILYGINRHNNSLILFDRFSLPNANSVIFATSGAGKSYTVKLEILRMMMFGTDVLVVDPENEYEYLAEAVGGAFLRLALNSEFRLNPFDLPRKVGDMTTEDVLRSAVINLKGLMRLIMGRMTKEEDSLIDRALIETYAKKDISPSSDLSQVIPPTMQDFQEILESMEGAENLVERVKKYTEGTFAGLFNEQTNIDIERQLVVFSIRDLEEELRPIAMYIIVNFIWNIVRGELKKRMLVVDEAWIMMQYEDSARFMFGIVKRGRKYYLGVTTISQDVNDFLTSDYGKAIVNNSSLRLLLRQSPSSIDLISKTFYLTEEEKYLLLESDVGEGLFFAGSKHVAIKVYASYSEDQLITTDPKQIMEIENAKSELEEEKQ